MVAGVAGVLLAGCSDGGSKASAPGPGKSTSATPDGPIIHTQDAGNVITTEDIEALVGRLGEALRHADVETMRTVVPDLKVGEWQRRLENLRRFPTSDVGFVLDETLDRMVNAAGGPVEIEADVALTHRISDVDSRPVVQTYHATMRKATPDSPLEILGLDGPRDPISPAPWDLRGWEMVEGRHSWVAVRTAMVDRVRANIASVDAGAARAMELIAPPDGVSKLFFAVAEVGDPLFGNGDYRPERDGFAIRAGYVDPAEVARTGKSAGPRAAYAGSRLMLRPGAFDSPARATAVAMHEAVHGLAYQWGDSDPWPAEGLATWGEVGSGAGVRAEYGGLVRSGFAGFRERMRGRNVIDGGVFQAEPHVSTNYGCAAAVFAFMEDRRGRDGALDFGRACYRKPTEEAVRTAGWKSHDALLAEVQSWVQSW